MNKDAVAEMSQQYQVEAAEKMVPEGYKQTEVGVIPEDWVVVPFGDLYEESIPRKRLKPNDLVTFIGMQDVSENAQLIGQHHIVYEQVRSGFTYFERGDVLVAKITPCFENGKGCHTETMATEVGFGSTEFHVLRAKNSSNSEFIYYWTVRESFRNSLELEMVGSAGHRRVPSSALQNYLIPSPSSVKEQTAIANALSDTDALLSELEKLIAKKHAIKTATMQQLLTGRTRLPQFANHPDGSKKGYKQSELGEIPEDWEVNPVGELGSFSRGRVISHNEINRSISKNYPVYSSQTLNDGVMGGLDTYDFEGEYITWTTDGVNAGKVSHRNGRFNCTNVCGVISIKTGYPKFIALAMNSEARKYVSTNLANPKLMNAEAKKVLIKTPCSILEQTAIATILSDMDEEIQALEQRLNKTRQIKQGMMQQLLTGKVRLV